MIHYASSRYELQWLVRMDNFLLMSEIDSNVKSTFKNKLCDTYHFKAFLLDEWEVRLYARIPFRHLDIVNDE